MLIKKEQGEIKQIAKESFVMEYKLRNKNIGVAKSVINGRFPENGWSLNKVCDEIYYVINGAGIVCVEDKEFSIKEGDILLINSNKKYYVQGKNLEILIATSPDWYPEQHKIIK